MKNTIYLIIFSIVFYGCSNKNKTLPNPSGKEVPIKTNILVSSANILKAKFYDELLYNRDGSYILRASKSLNQQSPEIFIGGEFFKEKDHVNRVKVADFITINNLEVSKYNVSNGYYSLTNNNMDKLGLYGKYLTFNFQNIQGRSSTSDSINFYSPNIINVNQNHFIQQTNKSIDRNSTINIEWNKDILNTNGVVVIVYWYGDINKFSDVNGNPLPNNAGTIVRNVDVCDDNGSYQLTSKNFKDIPKDAKVDIIVLRGNYKLSEIQNIDSRIESYTDWTAYGMVLKN